MSSTCSRRISPTWDTASSAPLRRGGAPEGARAPAARHHARHHDAGHGWMAGTARAEDRPADARHPVILISIVDQKELGFRLGATDYVVKPFEREALIGALARALRTCRASSWSTTIRTWPNWSASCSRASPCTIDGPPDGAAGLERIAQARPGVILLDLLMPRMDGLALLEALQSDPAHRDIPVVVLTAEVAGPRGPRDAEGARAGPHREARPRPRGADPGDPAGAAGGGVRDCTLCRPMTEGALPAPAVRRMVRLPRSAPSP